MTPAEQIRATMALLEGIAESKSAVDLVKSIEKRAREEIDDHQELDEGAAKNTVAALLAAASMAFSAGAGASNVVDDGICAGTMAVAAGAANGQAAVNLSDAASKFAARAEASGNSQWRRVMAAAAEVALKHVQNGQPRQLLPIINQCFDNNSAFLGQARAGTKAAQPAPKVDQYEFGEAAFDRWFNSIRNGGKVDTPESQRLFKAQWATLKTEEARDAFETSLLRAKIPSRIWQPWTR